MFKSVLVPVDGSSHSWSALQQAIWIAKREDASIRLVHVVDIRLIVPSAEGGMPNFSYQQQLVDYLEEAGKQILEEAKGRCDAEDIPCKTALITGTTANVICEQAHMVDLIAMGHRGAGESWAGLMLGSTFENVVRQANKPVLACPRAPRLIRKLLVAYDGSRMANDALFVAAHMATDWRLPMVLLTVADGDAHADAVLEEGKAYLASYDLDIKPVLAQGHPAEEILRVSVDEDCDLTIMGAYGHGRFLKILFGTTVDEVMRKSRCPVLICR